MFILRKINGQGIQSNFCISDHYVLIREEDTEKFEETMSLEKFFSSFKDDIYAFIVYNEGRDIMPLYKKQQNYIMTGEGKTFANVTFKD